MGAPSLLRLSQSAIALDDDLHLQHEFVGQLCHGVVVKRLSCIVVQFYSVLLKKKRAFFFEKPLQVVVNQSRGRTPRVDVEVNEVDDDELHVPHLKNMNTLKDGVNILTYLCCEPQAEDAPNLRRVFPKGSLGSGQVKLLAFVYTTCELIVKTLGD
jgi:hypothetical protein